MPPLLVALRVPQDSETKQHLRPQLAVHHLLQAANLILQLSIEQRGLVEPLPEQFFADLLLEYG